MFCNRYVNYYIIQTIKSNESFFVFVHTTKFTGGFQSLSNVNTIIHRLQDVFQQQSRVVPSNNARVTSSIICSKSYGILNILYSFTFILLRCFSSKPFLFRILWIFAKYNVKIQVFSMLQFALLYLLSGCYNYNC